MSYRLPDALQDERDDTALSYLRTYYGTVPGATPYTGSYFDGWGHDNDPYRFTAEDLVAVTFLSVVVKPMAAQAVLGDRAGMLSALLRQIDPADELVDVGTAFTSEHPVWRLDTALRGLKKGIGRTISSKLLARKRPLLVPVYDTVIDQVTNASEQWNPLRLALQADSRHLHERLARLRHAAGVDERVPVLRVYDVVCWMEGKVRRVHATEPDEQLGARLTDD